MTRELEDAYAREQGVDPNQHVLVRAPAGSGKTTLLVQRYLRLLAVVPEPESILAITFTRKAAAEMRARVLNALASSQTREAQAARDADLAMNWGISSNPNRLKIQTIDSFALSLARSLPLTSQLRLQANLTQTPEPLFEQAAQETLETLYNNNDSQALRQFVSLMEGDMGKAARQIAAMLDQRDLWMQPVAQFVRQFLTDPSAVNEYLEAALDTVLATLSASLSEHLGASNTTRLLELAAMANPHAQGHPLALWQSAADLLLTKAGKLRKTITIKSGLDKPQQLELRDFLSLLAGQEGALQPLQQLPVLAADDAADIATLASILTLSVMQLNSVFAAQGVSDFSELLICASRALADENGPTDLALALDYRIDHLLIDEFQDTSASQFHLFEQLVAGWDASQSNKSFFAVGDPLQSIYRFRGADASLFEQAWHQGIGDLPLLPIELTSNFRSQANLVEFCNATFEQLFQSNRNPLAGQSPYTRCVAIQEPTLKDAVTLTACADDEQANELVAQHIATLQAQHPQDSIGLLVRTKTHLAGLLDRLRAHGISWQGQDIDELARFPVALDLRILIKALFSPADPLTFYSLLRTPMLGLCLADLLAIKEASIDLEPMPFVQWLDAIVNLVNASADAMQRLQRLQEVVQAHAG